MTLRVAAVHRYFWPDTPPYASILRAIGERWSGADTDVTVLTAQPSYLSAEGIDRRPRKERLDDLAIERVRVIDERRTRVGKLLNMLLFPGQIAARIMRISRPDVVMCSTAPQVTLGVAVSLAAKARGSHFIYHCMDLHPEIGVLSGEFRNPLIRRVLTWLDTGSMRRAAAVVVLSEDMRRAVLDRDPALADRVMVLNNFALPDFEGAAATDGDVVAAPEPGTLRIVFTGNLGRFQRLDEVIGALAGIDRDVELVLMGEGHAKPAIREASAGLPPNTRLRVTLLPHGSPAAARSLMQTAHLGLVSLMPGVVRYAYPSKTATYLNEGLPLLVYCEADSELAKTVSERQLGWAASNPEELATAVRAAADECVQQNRFHQLVERIRAHAGSKFDQEAALTRWQALLDHVHAGGSPARV